MTVPSRRPRFSVVATVHDVAPYLPEFIASIAGQALGVDRLEVIAVDHGSSDDSLRILEAWAARRPELVTVLHQGEAGQASARNLGLAEATGEWVTFVDGEDVLDVGFFRAADAFATAHPDVQVMASRQVILDEDGRIRDRQSRTPPFGAGNRVANLDREPGTLAEGATVCLYRLDRFRAVVQPIDPRVLMTGDADVVARFVLELDRPNVGLLSDARYLSRKRRERPSAREYVWAQPERYGPTLEHGLLDLVERGEARHGSVPAWLQHMLLGELSSYLAEDLKVGSRTQLPDDATDHFHDLLGRVARALDPDLVRRFAVEPHERAFEDLVIHAFRDEPWHSAVSARTKVDEVMGLQRLEYRYVGTPPREAIRIDGRDAQPAWAKTVAITLFRRTVMFERLLWLPTAGNPEVELDGVRLGVEDRAPNGMARNAIVRHHARRRARSATAPPGRARRRGLRSRLQIRARIRSAVARGRRSGTLAAARFGPIGGRYRDAWVLIDRVYTANDNGERLFDHLRAHRPDINAWFVVERGTDDWARLRRARQPRLIAYGSWRWKLLMLRCAWVVSSHIDDTVNAPVQLAAFLDAPTWRSAFLQHGVIKDDLSSWLNVKDVELFVTSTRDELESIAGDGTRYRFTRRECRNVGLPRFDRLRELGRAVPETGRDLVVILPTWRMWLTVTRGAKSQRRDVRDSIWESEYLQAWSAILQSEAIAVAVARTGRTLAFVPHPNIRPILDEMQLPEHVRPIPIDGGDFQAVLARSALFVTDYSSVAFDAAYLDRRVVYYQFDREQALAGSHVGRKGYFEYERDGFGPVAMTHDEAVAMIVAAIDAGPAPDPEYQRRIDATFPERDGRACERVIATIEELSRPYRATAATRAERPA